MNYKPETETNFDYEQILHKIATNIYEAVFDLDKKELLSFDFLNFHGFSKWPKDKLNKDFILKNIIEEDLKKDLEKIEKLKTEDYVELEHRFKGLNGKIIFVRAKLLVLKREGNIVYCIGIDEQINKEKEYEGIVNSLIKSNEIGYVVFKENKIIEVNDFVCELVGESKEEIKKHAIEDYIKNVSSYELQSVVRQRSNGEGQFIVRDKIELIGKKRAYVRSFAFTSLFDGEYVGIAFIIDITKLEKRIKFSEIINDLSKNILEFESRESLFDNLIQILHSSGYKVSLKIDNSQKGDFDFTFSGEELKVFKCINGQSCGLKKIDENIKSLIYMHLKDNIDFAIGSEYEDEFDYDFADEYIKLKNILDLAIDNIDYKFSSYIIGEAIEKSLQWVLISDGEGNIVYANDTVKEISGYEIMDIIGKNPKIFSSGEQNSDFYKKMWEKLKNGEIFEAVFKNKNKKGEIFYLKTRIVPVEFAGEYYYVALGIDVTKETSLKQDVITGLLTRREFLNRLREINEKNKYALFIMDIRNFKAINQTKGTKEGDKVLKDFAKFLKNFFYSKDIIARLAGDDFAVLMQYKSDNDLSAVVNRLKNDVKFLPYNVNIGIAVYPENAKNYNELMEHAYSALTEAKKIGENAFLFYSKDLKENMNKLMNAKELINKGLENDLFEYHFQPYLDLKNNKIVGAEALLRLKDEKGGYISPGMFIDVAEKSGKIKDIELKLIEKVPYYVEKLKIPLSLNFTAKSLTNTFKIKSNLEKNIKKITIELTERELSKNLENTEKILKSLKKIDFNIAIDDFGTGYSTFTYLKKLNFDVLKIDMSFIKDMKKDNRDFKLVKNIISLAKELGLKTIAEGVETKEQFEMLKEMGCDIVQGYYVAKPMPLEEAIKFINNFNGMGG